MFTRYIEPRREEHLMRKEVIDKVTKVIRAEWPNSTVSFIFAL